MLGGLDPILIFQFARNVDPEFVGPVQPSVLSRIPIVSQVPTLVDMPPIPIYLSEELTGIFIDSEDKNVDITTDTETLSNGEAPDVNQKGIATTIAINLFAKKDSLGMSLLSAMIDQVFDKLTSKEYAITYLHGPITVFRGVLSSYSVNQNSENELLTIKLELTRGKKQPTKKPEVITVPGQVGALPGG